MKGYTGEYTQEQAQQSVEGLQQRWIQICADSLNTSAKVGDPNRTTYSFSTDYERYLIALEIPILIIYGTADIGATSNDMLPLEFARRGKRNLVVKAYPNHDHTFYKLTFDDKGKVISKIYNGVTVEKDYFQWLQEH
jgi:pimeloyl-ACP methyl ester carboxylesterase